MYFTSPFFLFVNVLVFVLFSRGCMHCSSSFCPWKRRALIHHGYLTFSLYSAMFTKLVWMNVRWRLRRLWSKGPSWAPSSARWRSWMHLCWCWANASHLLSAGKACTTTSKHMHACITIPHLCPQNSSSAQRWKRENLYIAGTVAQPIALSSPLFLYKQNVSTLIAGHVWRFLRVIF